VLPRRASGTLHVQEYRALSCTACPLFLFVDYTRSDFDSAANTMRAHSPVDCSHDKVQMILQKDWNQDIYYR